jgi:Ti-type conjugative transfer relaxase TraA
MIPRSTVGKGITGAARYVLGEGRDPATGALRRLSPYAASRVAWIGGTGFGFEIATREDADLARKMMEFLAQNQTSRTRRCDKDCLHLSLGWRPGETPSRAEMEAAALEALTALGMGDAHALFVAHADESYAHLHIVASRISPQTGRAYDLKGDYLKLSKWAEAYERSHSGVVCTAREDANELRDAITGRDADAVLELVTKHRATFTRRDLDRTLNKQIKDDAERIEFAARILALPEAVALSDVEGGPTTRYSTRTIIEAEGHVMRAAAGLARNHRHALPDRFRTAVMTGSRYAGISREQAEAVRRVTGAEGIALIDGQAGTGKSFTMAAIRQAYEAARYQVVGLAPTNAVAQDMKRDGFLVATTIHSQLFALNNKRARWGRRTVVMVDEAAMIDTKLMAMLTAHAYQAGAKLILVGDDRQLSSIDYGGMFGVLRDRHGAAELSEVRRQSKVDERRATELLAEGKFVAALGHYEAKGAIHWRETMDEARAALVASWAEDSLNEPDKSRFVFAYTNNDVDRLNRDLRAVRLGREELGTSYGFDTKHGYFEFAAGDRIQFTGTDKVRGILNGNAGVIERIRETEITIRFDGDQDRRLTFDAEQFIAFRHGYAGTIYKGQGRTIDAAYLYHTNHWRRAASYVALSRHREKVGLFVARDVALGLRDLAWQMARREERRAASHFFHDGVESEPVRPLTPAELAARLTDRSLERRHRQARLAHEFAEAADETVVRHSGANPRAKEKEKTKRKAKGKDTSRQGDPSPSLRRQPKAYRQAMGRPARARAEQAPETHDDAEGARPRRDGLLELWRHVAALVTNFLGPRPGRPKDRRRHHGPGPKR